MALIELQFEYEYRSDQSNLVDQFYVPCFSQSVEYKRAVGYFTSHGLALAGKGLATFIHSGGYMRLIASPLLEISDIEALTLGYENKQKIIERSLLKQLDEKYIKQLTTANITRFECITWLIANGHLSVKIAIPKKGESLNNQAIYHEKIGIFIDSDGNTVAFTGSPNETVGGLVSNFESIDVYLSWDDPQGRAKRKNENFERLWNNCTQRIEIFDFPDAARNKLLEYKPKRPPKLDPESGYKPMIHTDLFIRDLPAAPEFKPPAYLSLYEHQKKAIKAWNDTEGKYSQAKRCGFLEMATGAGKTITALCIGSELYTELGRLAIVIVAPTKILVEQWALEAEKFGLYPIKANSNYSGWKQEAWSIARSFNRRYIDRAVLIATNRTFATKEFQKIISKLGKPILLIADEAHNLGAKNTVKYLQEDIEYRLALSATPVRYFDEEGTIKLLDYFGETEFAFPISEAIGVCLTPYDYYITPVELTIDEIEEYRKLTERIRKLTSLQTDDDEKNSQIERLRIARARIISNAEGKVKALSSALKSIDLKAMRHMLVYTSDKNPEQTLQVINLLQKDKHMLVHQFTEEESGNTKQREELIKRFAEGENLQALVAKRCLDEGVDIPPTRYGYFLASTSNPRQYIQRRGRLLRKFPSKTHAVIHDFFVIPPTEGENIIDDYDKNVVTSELRRIVEFASIARNGASARISILDIARKYGVTDMLGIGGNL